jgi:AsmA protein
MTRRTLLLALAAAVVVGTSALVLAGERLIVRIAVARLEAATGRAWSVGGAALSVWPAGVTLRDLATETDLGPAGRTSLAIAAMRLDGTVGGLLAGEADRVEIVRPALQWPAQWWRGTGPLPDAAAAPSSAFPSLGPRPRRIAVRDGSLALTEAGRTVAAIDGISAAVEPRGDGHAVTLSGRAGSTRGTCDLTVAPTDGAPAAENPVAIAFTCRAPEIAGAPLVGTADATLSGAALTLARLTGSLGPDRFTGGVLVDLARKPFVRLDLAFDALSLGTQAATDRLPDLSILRLFDGRVRLRATSLAVGQTRLADLDLDLRLADGTVDATLAQAGLQGGQVRGRLTTTLPAAPEDAPRHALTLELARARALPLLSDLAGFALLDGTASATLDLRGEGRDGAAIRRSLAGKAALLLENGRLVGIDIPGVVQSMAARVSAADTTAFDRLSLRVQIQDGRATTEELAFAGPLVTAGGSGTIDFGERSLSFRIAPRLSRSAARALPRGLDVSVPVIINGAWDAPQIHVDLAGLMTDGQLVRGLESVGTDLLGGRNGGVGGLLDMLMPREGAGQPPSSRRQGRP